MSRLCLLCGENETPEGKNLLICDTCFDHAGNYLEQNARLIKAIPHLVAALKGLVDAFDMPDVLEHEDDLKSGVHDPASCALCSAQAALAMADAR